MNGESSRRTVLELLGSGVAAASGVSRLSAAASERGTAVETLRGSPNSPLTPEEVDERRRAFVERHAPTDSRRVVFTDLEETVGDSRVLGYNLTVDDAGVPREQFATRSGPADAPSVGARQADRLHDRADELLAEATAQEEPSNEISTRDNQERWRTWIEHTITDTVHEFPKAGDGTRPGRVRFENRVSEDRDANRIGARTRVRMEPGRQICAESDVDGFCPSLPHVEYRNKFGEVTHDWDAAINDAPAHQSLTDVSTGLSDEEQTQLASIGLDVERSDPAGWVGYETRVSVLGADVVDATVAGAGQSRHKFDVDSPASVSAKTTAEFEIGSVARWSPEYGGGSASSRRILGIGGTFEWGVSLPFVGWGNTVSSEREFVYVVV